MWTLQNVNQDSGDSCPSYCEGLIWCKMFGWGERGHFSCHPLRSMDICDCHCGWNLNKLNLVCRISLDGCWWHSGNTQEFRLERPGSNPRCDETCAPLLIGSYESETQAWCFPNIRLAGWSETVPWNVRSEGQQKEREHKFRLCSKDFVDLLAHNLVERTFAQDNWTKMVKCSLK